MATNYALSKRIMNYEDILIRKLVSLFPDRNCRERISNILDEYGVENYEHEPHRVRLAVLKLCGANESEISKMISNAKIDYRDILSWAEYPRQSKEPLLRDSSKKQKLIEKDMEEYQNWLAT